MENVRNKALVQLRYDLEKEHAFNLEKERRTWQHKHKHSLGSSQTSKAAMLKELKIDFSTKLQQLKQMHALQMEEFRCNSDQTLKKLIVKLAKYEKIFQSRREGTATASSPFSNYKRSGESRETENAQLKKINGNLRQQVKLLQSSSSSLPRVHRNEAKDTPASTAEKKAEAQQQRSTLSSSSSSFSSSSSVTRTTRMRHRHQSTPALVVSPPVKTPTPRRRKTKYTVEEDHSPTPSSTRSRASPSGGR